MNGHLANLRDSVKVNTSHLQHLEGVYPQDDGSIAIVDIDASKGFIDLWVHFFVAIEDNYFDGKYVFWVSTKFKNV